ncbi:hypothetical protein IJ21_39280 [Paenibacillus sp. 32O-W]|jgi:hypothetical protein|nr:hypothetical protein IJ21_39280 [Paenibacillus sp. 32O-W]
MYIITGTAALLGAAVLAAARIRGGTLRRLIDGAAALALLVVFAAAAVSIYRTVAGDTVFLTQIHELLLNPAFMAGGAYLAVYALSLLGAITLGLGD